MQLTAGLVLRKNTKAEKDAEAIKLLRSAGAIPLALTNVSELAMWWESYNRLFGTTKNPYNTRYNMHCILISVILFHAAFRKQNRDFSYRQGTFNRIKSML